MNRYSVAGAFFDRAQNWSADQTFLDSIALTFGTGGDVDLSYNGTNFIINPIVVGSGAVVLGSGEAGTTLATGATLRGPDITTGGAGNVAGADFTIAVPQGTGTGDVGRFIISLPIVAAAGDNLQTRAERLAFDMAGSSTLLEMTFAQAVNLFSTSGITVGLAASAPAPDLAGFHIWLATAGAVTAVAESLLTLENSGNTYIQLLSGATSSGGIFFGDTVNSVGGLTYSHSTNVFTFRIDNANILSITGSAFTLGARDWSITQSSAGVARSFVHDITVGAGGAANNVLQHAFHLDSVIEAGLLGETDGSGTYTQLKSVWKIPYADAGAGTIGPTAPTTAATWNGGLFLGASNAVANGRLYWNANEALHYVDATAGFSFLYKEPTTFGDFNKWEFGDLLVLKVDRYTEDGGHALPYPFDKATREALLKLLDVDAEFRQQVKERLGV